MADRLPEVHRAIVAALKGDAGVAARVGARVYDRPPAEAAFPFLEIGDAVVIPWQAEALDGSEISLAVHVWSRAPGGRGEAREIAALVRAALDDAALALAAGATVLCRCAGARDMRDPDGITAHAVIDFSILTQA